MLGVYAGGEGEYPSASRSVLRTPAPLGSYVFHDERHGNNQPDADTKPVEPFRRLAEPGSDAQPVHQAQGCPN